MHEPWILISVRIHDDLENNANADCEGVQGRTVNLYVLSFKANVLLHLILRFNSVSIPSESFVSVQNAIFSSASILENKHSEQMLQKLEMGRRRSEAGTLIFINKVSGFQSHNWFRLVVWTLSPISHPSKMDSGSGSSRQHTNPMAMDVDIPKRRPTAPPRSSFSNAHRASSVPLHPSEFTVGYVYSTDMTQHFCRSGHPEQPERISRIYRAITDAHYHHKMKRLPIRPVKREEALLVHSEDHWEKVQTLQCKYLTSDTDI